MKRIQTYFAVLSTILGIMAAVVATVITDLGLGIWATAWLLTTGAAIAFLLSLVIGHYIAEPLRDLHHRTDLILHGDTAVSFTPTDRLHEADVLAADFAELGEQTKTKMSDLALAQKRQAAFINDVAHELRTPLTAIRGNAETLVDPDMPQVLRERFCNTIISESERLTRLSNDLLTLQHIEDGSRMKNLERVNLHDVATAVVDSLDSMLEEQDAHVIIIGEAPDVLGIPDRLRQAVYNLVANAARFIERGGHITISLEGLQGQSILKVIDDGPGIGDINPELLFTRFYRGDNSRARDSGGTGLGLAIVKSVITEHDGSVTAFNAAGGGACFVITLPSVG